jgi:adenine-specific DNA-methyltransferase
MKTREPQTFLSIYYEPNAVEVATGDMTSDAATAPWKADSRLLGQVSTPAPIAALMAKWVMSGNPRAVLDPAAGLGGLLTACRVLDEKITLVGVERDVVTLQRAKNTAPRNTKLIVADYLKSEVGQFDGIIANPPYVKAHRLDYVESEWRYFEELLGTPLDRLTNLYALFLLKIWNDLALRGRAAVILPAEFLNANFGEEIKERLLKAVRPVVIAVFDPSLNVFSNALTTSAIIFLEKGRALDRPVWGERLQSIEAAQGLVDSLIAKQTDLAEDAFVDLGALKPQNKWLNVLLNGAPMGDVVTFSKCVGDYFTCSRGIATGANDYFCLSTSELAKHRLNLTDFVPCITKATDADGLVFTRQKFESLVAADRRCFLLSPNTDEAGLKQYLKLGEDTGISKRHLPSHRPTWYLPESRAIASIWAAVFSRDYAKFILNRSGAKNLTCFHGLYARAGYERLASMMTLFLNCSAGRKSFARVNRFYGDGLNKLEPKDVESMPCPDMPELTEREAENITSSLIQAECMTQTQQRRTLDQLAAQYLNLTLP